MIKTNQEKFNELLNEIENILWEDEFQNAGQQTKFTDKTLGSACKIYSYVLLSKMWDFQEKHQMPQEDRESYAEVAGHMIRNMVLDYTGIDTHKIYNKE